MSATAKAINPESSGLVRYDEMCRAISAAYDVDEVKDIRDKARAIEMYARQAKNTEAERKACEIRLRAERRAGQLSAVMETAQGRRSDLTSTHRASKLEALEQAGISRDQATRWERMAAVPDDEFERAVKQPKATTSNIVALAPPSGRASEQKRDQVDPRALWLWGRLLDFEREGILDADPGELLASMLDHMRATTKEMAPRVIAWLRRLS